MQPSTPRRIDRLLLAEIGMVLALIALGTLIYLRPAAERLISPPWWHWVALGLLFFAVVGLHTYRRRLRRHAALHDALQRRR